MPEGIDIVARSEGIFRVAVWTVGPAIERRYPELVGLDADVVVMARTANEVRLLRAGCVSHNSMAWVGRHAQRGLGTIGFGATVAKLDGGRWDQRLEWIAPVSVALALSFDVLAVWALNDKSQVKFKSKPPASQPIQMMRLYKQTMAKPCIIAGDFNNNPVFHRNDPNWDMLELVALLEAQGFVSAYHSFAELEHGDPREQSTRFMPDPAGGLTQHHVDYCFVPRPWLPALRNVQIGDRNAWIGTVQAEEHVPVVCDFDVNVLGEIIAQQKK